MNKNKSPMQAVLDELKICEKLLQLWLILKNGEVVGKITARTGRNEVIHVAVIMYPTVIRQGIFGYLRMTGGGYPKVKEGIATILRDNKEILRKVYRVVFPLDIMTRWREGFETCGYNVIEAL